MYIIWWSLKYSHVAFNVTCMKWDPGFSVFGGYYFIRFKLGRQRARFTLFIGYSANLSLPPTECFIVCDQEGKRERERKWTDSCSRYLPSTYGEPRAPTFRPSGLEGIVNCSCTGNLHKSILNQRSLYSQSTNLPTYIHLSLSLSLSLSLRGVSQMHKCLQNGD